MGSTGARFELFVLVRLVSEYCSFSAFRVSVISLVVTDLKSDADQILARMETDPTLNDEDKARLFRNMFEVRDF